MTFGVFFHRSDTLADGESSSGVPWLGDSWLVRTFGTLVPGGLLVTDGSKCPVDGPLHCGHSTKTRPSAPDRVGKASSSELAGRRLACVGYAGSGKGPTLLWRVD